MGINIFIFNMKYAALIASASAMELMNPNMYKFMEYVGQHGKSYATKEEFNFRFAIYDRKLAEIEHLNKTEKYSTHGTNFMTDYTDDEIKGMLGWRADMNTHEKNVHWMENVEASPIDWRQKGAVTPVKNQGQCGSCWSFSTTGALEGAHHASTGKLVSLSESQFVNCCRTCHGCEGGLMDLAFKYAESAPVMTEADWPYEPHSEPFSCYLTYKANKGVLEVKSYKDVPHNQPAQLQAFLATGPVSIAIEADKTAFQSYTSGVLSGSACGTQMDHGVLTVGWGNDASAGAYFIVKNSWGPNWGDQGYIKLAVADGPGTCGMNQQASQPTTIPK